MSLQVTALYTYPVKSCGRLSHDERALEARGLVYDRRWMVVSDAPKEQGGFLTQRELPTLALIQPSFAGEQLALNAPRMPEICVPLAQHDGEMRDVVVWHDMCRAVDEGDTLGEWLSDYLHSPVRLVRMADDNVRAVDPAYAKTPAQVGFADAYPLLLTAESSLDDLNQRLSERGKTTVPMTRFRPNVVVSGTTPFEEDGWTRIEIGGIPFDAVKPCARCVTTTVDQDKGIVLDSDEPLGTLATFRRSARGVLFGQNIIHRGGGTLRVGDAVTIL